MTVQTLKGFRDFLPQDARKRTWVKNIMVKTAELWGYEPIETPTLEPYALFKDEIGEDSKLIFKFTDNGEREIALRYDQTVPTCRYVANNFNSLTFPFRRYQYQSVFRAEKPQKGRYREFTQFDLDIFGVKNVTADAEVMAVNLDTYLKIGFKQPVIIFNNRDLMAGIPYDAIVAIDKLKKIGKDGVIEDMVKKGINLTDAKKYFDQVQNIKPDETINTITNYLENSGFDSKYFRFEPTLARSFSYSQGPIWEIVIEDYLAGSVGGGERYDGMMERMTGLKIPATGIAYGFDRTVEAADQLGLIPKISAVSQVLVTIFSPFLLKFSINLARQLRGNKLNIEIYPDSDTKLNKQLKYANDKGIPFVAIIGENEVAKNMITLKNMASGAQQTYSNTDLVNLAANVNNSKF